MSAAPTDAKPTAATLRRDIGLFLMSLFVVYAYGLLARAPNSEATRTLSLIFASIMLEAMPFMLIGAVVGGLIEAFVSRERMAALLPRNTLWAVAVAAGLGILFPVCECAVVPVVRRLARKGLAPAAAIAYLLGGPICNPVVAASTALAYPNEWYVVALRMGLGYGIAVAVALAMHRLFRTRPILLPDATQGEATPCGHGCCAAKPPAPTPNPDGEDAPNHSHHDHGHHDHGHEHAHDHDHGHDHAHGHAPHDPRAAGAPSAFRHKLAAAFRHAAEDFLAVGHFLVIGAFLAALAQTYIDRGVFLEVAELPVLPSLAMIGLAILLNLCSEADAFIAASFRGLMPLSAQLAFMLTGPIFDLKLLLMYQGVFRKRAIVALALLILGVVTLVALGLELAGLGYAGPPGLQLGEVATLDGAVGAGAAAVAGEQP